MRIYEWTQPSGIWYGLSAAAEPQDWDGKRGTRYVYCSLREFAAAQTQASGESLAAIAAWHHDAGDQSEPRLAEALACLAFPALRREVLALRRARKVRIAAAIAMVRTDMARNECDTQARQNAAKAAREAQAKEDAAETRIWERFAALAQGGSA